MLLSVVTSISAMATCAMGVALVPPRIIPQVGLTQCQISESRWNDMWGHIAQYKQIFEKDKYNKIFKKDIEANLKGCKMLGCRGESAIYICGTGEYSKVTPFSRKVASDFFDAILKKCKNHEHVYGRTIDHLGRFSLEFHGCKHCR